jgi:RNA polymerase sigma factor (sigma-70 family)
MPTQDQDFEALIQGIREGSNAAFEQLVTIYGKYIYRIVRRKLAPAMRPLFDSADFMQSVWAASFANRERLANCQNAYELINFLSKVAGDRVIDERRRRLKFARRNVNREIPLAELPEEKTLAVSGPTPSQIAVAHECEQRLTQDQRTQIRLLVLMKLDGATHEEIAGVLGVDPKTIQRLLRRLEREVHL